MGHVVKVANKSTSNSIIIHRRKAAFSYFLWQECEHL